MSGTKHFVIPDVQAKPGVLLNHCEWVGKYIAEKKPDVVINLGDHCDVASLSSWDRGKKQFEGRRFTQDVEVSNVANDLLIGPLSESDHWDHCETHILYGNHENRIVHFTDKNPELDGFVSLEALGYAGYYDHVHDFLVPVTIDGVAYSHYFYQPDTGRPFSGMMETRLKNIGFSFTMGHQQGIKYGIRPLNNGHMHHGLIAGSCYLHYEDYRGPQANDHWRGVVMKYGVHDGEYDIKVVGLDALCQRYEGVTLKEFFKLKDRHIIV